MHRVTITEFMDGPAVEALRLRCDVFYDPGLVDDAPRLHAAVRGADAVIVRNRTQVRGELLAAMDRARVIGRLGVGLDNIDLAACAARGMRVIPATGANARAVAEYVLGTALLLLRGAYQASDEVARGDWPRERLSMGREIFGKTLGLVGLGAIGRLTAQLAQGLGMRVIAHDPGLAADAPSWACGAQPRALDALLAEADVVSLHLPLTEATRGLLSARRLALMRPDAVLVNTARGGLCDEAAVAQALRDGRLGGAAFDVFESEPLPAGSPWQGCPRLVLSPHVAGVTREANARVSALIAEQVFNALDTPCPP